MAAIKDTQDFETNDVSRDPKSYTPDKHAIYKHKVRDNPGWLIEYLIKHGRIVNQEDGTDFKFVTKLKSEYENGEVRTHKWTLPVRLFSHGKNDVKTSPYVYGMTDEEIAAIDPIKPEGF